MAKLVDTGFTFGVQAVPVTTSSFTFGVQAVPVTTSSFTFGSVLPSYTGYLRERRNEDLLIEWKIDNFLQETFHGVRSRDFTFSSTTCYLELDTCFDAISLYLCHNVPRGSSHVVEFQLGQKKLDGDLCFQQTFIRKFEGRSKHGFEFFAKRSNLKKLEEETKIDSLTVVCKLRSVTSPRENNGGCFPGLLGMLSSKKYSDVTIKVKDQEFQAHKVILAASSIVFSNIMSENKSGALNIEDCEPKSFKDFLNFLYTGETNITKSNVHHLYHVGQKYCVESLIPYCVAHMILHLSVNTVCDVAILGHRYSDNNITFACSEFFEQNVRQVLLTSQWKLLMKNNYLVAFKLLDYIAHRITVEKKINMFVTETETKDQK